MADHCKSHHKYICPLKHFDASQWSRLRRGRLFCKGLKNKWEILSLKKFSKVCKAKKLQYPSDCAIWTRSALEMGPYPTPEVNKGQTRLWCRYFLTRPDGIFWLEGENWKIWETGGDWPDQTWIQKFLTYR